jgi:hypothetical protein
MIAAVPGFSGVDSAPGPEDAAAAGKAMMVTARMVTAQIDQATALRQQMLFLIAPPWCRVGVASSASRGCRGHSLLHEPARLRQADAAACARRTTRNDSLLI